MQCHIYSNRDSGRDVREAIEYWHDQEASLPKRKVMKTKSPTRVSRQTFFCFFLVESYFVVSFKSKKVLIVLKFKLNVCEIILSKMKLTSISANHGSCENTNILWRNLKFERRSDIN